FGGICRISCVARPIGLPRLRFACRCRRRLNFVICDRLSWGRLFVHDIRKRSGTEINGYEQWFRMIEGIRNGGEGESRALVRVGGRRNDEGSRGVSYHYRIDGIVGVHSRCPVGLRDVDSVYREASWRGAKDETN